MTSPSKPIKQYDSSFVRMNCFGVRTIQNGYNYGDLPLALVAMATESSCS